MKRSREGRSQPCASRYLVAASPRPNFVDGLRCIGSAQPDLPLRAAARAIYDACYPSEEWAPYGFEEAERFGTVHYRQAVGAAQRARAALADRGEQLTLPALL